MFKNIYLGDCGFQNYMNWCICLIMYVDDGLVDFKGDFLILIGKYYLDEEINIFKMIKVSDKYLIGQCIKMCYI